MNDNLCNNESIVKNEEHIRKIYSDKACKFLNISLALSIFVFIGYVLNMGHLVVFNILNKLVCTFFYTLSNIIIIVSAVFAYITKDSIEVNKIERAKRFIFFAIISAFISTLFTALFCIINPNIINLRSLLIANGNYEFESALTESGIGLFNGREIACYASILGSVAIFLIIVILQYRAINSILKADGTVKSTDFAENFYDKL